MQALVAGSRRISTPWFAAFGFVLLMGCGDDGGAPDLLPPGFDSSFSNETADSSDDDGTGGGMVGDTDGDVEDTDGGSETGDADAWPWPDDRYELPPRQKKTPRARAAGTQLR